MRETRRRLRLSQHDLANRIDVSRQWIQRLEEGRPGIELGLTLRALTALGIVLDATDEATRAGRVALVRGARDEPTTAGQTDVEAKPDRASGRNVLAVADIDFLVDSLVSDSEAKRLVAHPRPKGASSRVNTVSKARTAKEIGKKRKRKA